MLQGLSRLGVTNSASKVFVVHKLPYRVDARNFMGKILTSMALASKSWVAGFVAFPSSPQKSRTACKRPGVGSACKRPDGNGGPLRFKEAGDFLHCESQGEVPWAWVDGELSEFQVTRPHSLTRYIDRKKQERSGGLEMADR